MCKSFNDLGPKDCRFVITGLQATLHENGFTLLGLHGDDLPASEFRFCGEAVKRGSYCAHHRSLCYDTGAWDPLRKQDSLAEKIESIDAASHAPLALDATGCMRLLGLSWVSCDAVRDDE
jgi:hypothetical protein